MIYFLLLVQALSFNASVVVSLSGERDELAVLQDGWTAGNFPGDTAFHAVSVFQVAVGDAGKFDGTLVVISSGEVGTMDLRGDGFGTWVPTYEADSLA